MVITDSRQRLLDALMTIISERGLDQASLREVATEAGVSVGTVQYYCRSKDEMLQMAFEHVIGRILERATGVERAGHVGAVLRRGLLEFLPLDQGRGVEARVYLAFAARAAVTPRLAAVQHRLMSRSRALCAQALALARERGQARPDLDAEGAAVAIVAMVDGLLLHMLSDPTGMPAEVAVGVLDEHLRHYVDIDVGIDSDAAPGTGAHAGTPHDTTDIEHQEEGGRS
ncbi:MAG: TetR family transcriptional regulator [Pseudonocardia sp.]|nr:TetR family transcriptional regulator [Pseudonocardia sp.]